MANKLNIIALVAGISTLLLIVISIFVPWWQFTIGKPALATVNFSPMNLDFALLGSSMTMPLILAFNIACILTLAAGGIIMLIYAVRPTKSYSKQLLGFGYKKPLYAVIGFVVELALLVTLPGVFAGVNVPLNGATTMKIPTNFMSGNGNSGFSISVSVSTALEWPFYLAIVVAGLCIAARLYHKKIKPDLVLPPPPPQQ